MAVVNHGESCRVEVHVLAPEAAAPQPSRGVSHLAHRGERAVGKRRGRAQGRAARVTWWIPAGYALFLGLVVYRNWTRRPQLADYLPQPSGPAGAALPLVSVIVPARDEAANIARCVRSILSARYAPLELIV